MTMVRFIWVFGSLLIGVGCGGEDNDADEGNIVVLQCGPNARLHGGLGNTEPHCDCIDGFKLYDGNCIPDDTQGADETDAAPSEENGPAVDNGGDTGQMRQPRPTTRAIDASCWRPPGSECDPRDATGCNAAAGETCDIAQTQAGEPGLVCLPGPNPQGLGESCEPSRGPFCGAGFRCT